MSMGMGWVLIIAAVLFAVFAVVGVCIVTHISNKKWGYTKEREEELERMLEQGNGNRE